MSNNIFQSTVASSTPGGGGVVNTTYTDLLNLIATNNLVNGTIYEFDYLLKFNMIGTAGEFTADNTEKIQVIALNTNTLRSEAYSVTYNENIIYDIENINVFNVSTINSTGYISCRFLDSLNLIDSNFVNYKVNFDFRNQYFYKYVTATNLVGFTNVDNATAFIKYFSITFCKDSIVNFCQNVEFPSIKNSTYLEDVTGTDYKKITLFNTVLHITSSSFLELFSVSDVYENVQFDNAKIKTNNCKIANSNIFNTTIVNSQGLNMLNSSILTCYFNNIYNTYLENSTLEICTSNNNFTINSIFSYIQAAADCYLLTYFKLNGSLLFFNNNDITKNSTICRYLEFATNGVNFCFRVGQGTVPGVYDICYLPNNFYTVSNIFAGLLTSPNANLGAVYCVGNNVGNNNIINNLAEITLILNNTNQNVASSIFNTGGLVNLEVLIANCNQTLYFEFDLKTNA